MQLDTPTMTDKELKRVEVVSEAEAGEVLALASRRALTSRSYAHSRVDVHQHLDGQLSVHYQGDCLIAFLPAVPGPVRVGQFTPHPNSLAMPIPPIPSPAPAPRTRTPYSPPPDPPWRRPFKSNRRNVYQQR